MKMSAKFVLSLVFLLKFTFSLETENTFVLVSSTANPLDHNEEAKIQEYDYRFLALETQIAQIQQKFQHLKEQSGNIPKSCKEVQEKGYNVSDIYLIQPKVSPKPFLVLCDMETVGGGWTYILNRFNGKQDFFLNWNDYKEGFGSLIGEFWLGLENIHYLTGYGVNELLVEMVDWESNLRYARYNTFGISNEKNRYALTLLEGYSGNATDALSYHIGMEFSTKDRDHEDCAKLFTGAWWYNYCKECQLTGQYLAESKKSTLWPDNGIYWGDSTLKLHLQQARMMVKERDHTKPILLPHKH